VLLEYARSFPEAQIVFETELTALEQDEEGVTATIIDRTTGDLTLVRARYVVAADGPRSPIREQLGISMQGPGRLTDYLTILFRADLKQLVCQREAGMNLHQQRAALDEKRSRAA
jgi:putative polyketide hydroxylase